MATRRAGIRVLEQRYRTAGRLEHESDCTGKELFARLTSKHYGRFTPRPIRTLQRRIREWWAAMARRLLPPTVTGPRQ